MARSHGSPAGGWTLTELLVVVAIIGLIIKISLPSMQNTILSFRLGAAASTVAGAIQRTRYEAIKNGCYYTIAFTASSTTYQVQTNTNQTNPPPVPPVCVTNPDGSPNFSNSQSQSDGSGGAVTWTSGGGISMLSSTTLEFGPNGIVGLPPNPATNPLSPCTPNCSFQLSNGNATTTITISGVGSVKVTSP